MRKKRKVKKDLRVTHISNCFLKKMKFGDLMNYLNFNTQLHSKKIPFYLRLGILCIFITPKQLRNSVDGVKINIMQKLEIRFTGDSKECLEKCECACVRAFKK